MPTKTPSLPTLKTHKRRVRQSWLDAHPEVVAQVKKYIALTKRHEAAFSWEQFGHWLKEHYGCPLTGSSLFILAQRRGWM